jgi:trans-aconitate methyltransferase
VPDVDRPAHWDERYASIGERDVSWFEAEPAASLELLGAVGVAPARSVIDVGGGASSLVDHLLARGHRDLTVLDLSAVALAAARQRLHDPDGVTWVEADVTTWRPSRTWNAWHDRAVLHFMTDDDDRDAYLAALRRAVEPGGAVVIGTFAEDGPTHCSALPVRRYAPDELVELLRDVDLDVVEQRRQVHRTPGGAEQPFTWVAGRRRPA